MSICIYFFQGRPIFFKQKRLGVHCEEITLIKFCTMKELKDSEGKFLSDFERTTTLGRFLRKSSLDEFPSILNVVKGELSLVGPRPLLIEYLPLYSKLQLRRHEVLPGITGWAQINGRNSISWDKKFKLDVWYVDNKSFCVDMKILFKTIGIVLKRKSINQSTNQTMEKFKGNENDV